jgi:4-hydroxybenzoate polyprenyltransferase
MKKILAFISITRPVNLLIIGLTQYLFRYGILIPMVQVHGLHVQISHLDFLAWVLGSVFIAAGGNVINDYFDIKIDRINKPHKIIVGRLVKRREAMMAHTVLTGAGVVLGLFIGYRSGFWALGLIHIIWASSLWFYSATYKRRFLSGNVIIAFCTALVPLSVVLLEIPAMTNFYQEDLLSHKDAIQPYKDLMKTLFFWALGFSGFAFLLTLAREITKDFVDIKGDREVGCQTVPIVLGLKKTKIVLYAIYGLSIIGLITLQQAFLKDPMSFIYLSVILTILMAVAIYFTWKSSEPSNFKRPSLVNKIIQIGGVLYTLIVYELLTQII